MKSDRLAVVLLTIFVFAGIGLTYFLFLLWLDRLGFTAIE